MIALHAGDAVVLGEAFVEHGEVAVQDVPHAEVVPEQFLEEVLRLGDHGLLQVLLELGVELGVGLGEVDAEGDAVTDGETLTAGVTVVCEFEIII